LEAFCFLAFDILQLTGLLFLTGGIENPFTLFLLAPVTISATMLSSRNTLILGSLAIFCVSVLANHHMPLPWGQATELVLPVLYVYGLWIALILGLGFTGSYAWRVSVESRRMSEALATTQLILAREQRLSALGGLAAAAAHELGTPLATIQLTARELERDISHNSPYAEDIFLISSQVARCRTILSELFERREYSDEIYSRYLMSTLLDEIVESYRDSQIEISIQRSGSEGPEPQVWRQPEIKHGLDCFIQNAVDFAESAVVVAASWDKDSIGVTIVDNGYGFSPEVLTRLGEPYITTRFPGAKKKEVSTLQDGRVNEGQGLGVFIAKTLLEHTSADVSFGNLPQNNLSGIIPIDFKSPHGAWVTVRWPREVIAAGPSASEVERLRLVKSSAAVAE
jgi:two-component system sensor histidine kinase RegB